MLPFFPTPYPDELFYSICARYHQRSANTSIRATVKDLFGSISVCAVADFPTHFDHLCGLLPEGTLNTADKLIYGHTMLPLYRLFLPKDRADKLVAWMKDSTRGNSIHVAIGAASSCIPLPSYFRYCRECVADDEEQHGESYWHRCHQVMGVKVCHKHHDWLFESEVPTSMQRNKHLFQLVPAESQLERGRSLKDDAGNLEIYRAIAEAVAWLLQNHDMRLSGLASLQKLYLHHLSRLGLAKSSGRVVQRELIARFVDHFGTDLLEQLHCGIDRSSQDNWLSTLVRKPRKSAHPIRHILFINFLGLKVDDFFKLERRHEFPFGRGPWPHLTIKSRKAPDHEQRETRRASWLLLRSKHPEKGRKELRVLDPADFKWLYRNDVEWLYENLPSAKAKKSKPQQRVDWVKRDCSLASRIMFAVKRIMGLQGRPVRVSIRSVGRMIGERSLLEKKLSKLPMTKATLDTLVESKEVFDVRRVRYAAAMLSERGEPLQAWRIVREACMRPGDSRRVSKEIERQAAQGFVEEVHAQHDKHAT